MPTPDHEDGPGLETWYLDIHQEVADQEAAEREERLDGDEDRRWRPS
jgi:hypothetical protein